MRLFIYFLSNKYDKTYDYFAAIIFYSNTFINSMKNLVKDNDEQKWRWAYYLIFKWRKESKGRKGISMYIQLSRISNSLIDSIDYAVYTILF